MFWCLKDTVVKIGFGNRNIYIYVYSYTDMAKTIMISNEVYNELKDLKKDKSFSELFKELLKTNNVKRVSGLRDIIGIMKNDKEWDKLEKERKIAWKNWTKKYV